jgi:hypothetical protein
LKASDWDKYRLAVDPKRNDFILARILADNPNFSDLEMLSLQIERGTLEFIKDMDAYLSNDQV